MASQPPKKPPRDIFGHNNPPYYLPAHSAADHDFKLAIEEGNYEKARELLDDEDYKINPLVFENLLDYPALVGSPPALKIIPLYYSVYNLSKKENVSEKDSDIFLLIIKRLLKNGITLQNFDAKLQSIPRKIFWEDRNFADVKMIFNAIKAGLNSPKSAAHKVVYQNTLTYMLQYLVASDLTLDSKFIMSAPGRPSQSIRDLFADDKEVNELLVATYQKIKLGKFLQSETREDLKQKKFPKVLKHQIEAFHGSKLPLKEKPTSGEVEQEASSTETSPNKDKKKPKT